MIDDAIRPAFVYTPCIRLTPRKGNKDACDNAERALLRKIEPFYPFVHSHQKCRSLVLFGLPHFPALNPNATQEKNKRNMSACETWDGVGLVANPFLKGLDFWCVSVQPAGVEWIVVESARVKKILYNERLVGSCTTKGW